MLSRKLVKLHTFELTDIPQVLGQNWENFVSHAPILVIFFTFVIRHDLHTNLSVFFHHTLTVLLPYLRKLVHVIWE